MGSNQSRVKLVPFLPFSLNANNSPMILLIIEAMSSRRRSEE